MLDGLPVWAKVISVVGAPTAAAAFLIYSLAVYLPRIEGELRAMETAAATIHEAYKAHMLDESKQDDRMIAVLSRVCLNGAKNDEDRLACVALGAK